MSRPSFHAEQALHCFFTIHGGAQSKIPVASVHRCGRVYMDAIRFCFGEPGPTLRVLGKPGIDECQKRRNRCQYDAKRDRLARLDEGIARVDSDRRMFEGAADQHRRTHAYQAPAFRLTAQREVDGLSVEMNFTFAGNENWIGIDDEALGGRRAIVNLKACDSAANGCFLPILAHHETECPRDINSRELREGGANRAVWQHRRHRAIRSRGKLMDRVPPSFEDEACLQQTIDWRLCRVLVSKLAQR